MLKGFIIILLFSCINSAFAQYSIGHTTITFNDPSRTGGFGSGGGSGRQIQTEIYYPASTAGNDVAPESGEFPIIVFGHGFVMSWDAYTNIWQKYVPLGYILAFPRTEGGFPDHQEFGLDLRIVEQKIQALSANTSSIFYQKTNGNSAIMGHSMGGGATILAGANNTSIKTIIGLAPAETDPSAIAAATNVTVPALIFSGGQDGVTPPVDHHIPIYNALSSSCKTFVNVVGGAHCYFANSNFNCDFGEASSSTGISITRSEQQQRTYSLLDPWLDYTLKGNCSSYDVFMNVLEATPTTLITQTECTLNPSVIILESGGVLTPSITGVSYQWFLDGNEINGAIANSFTPTSNGEYTVAVTFLNGCKVSAPYIVTGLNTIEQASNEFSVYPNPTDGKLVIQTDLNDLIEVKVFDQAGKLLMSEWVFNEISIAHLSRGLYVVMLNGKSYSVSKQ